MPSRPNRSAQGTRGGRVQASNQVVLERVLGFTSANNCALSLDPTSGTIAYAAGCVIVLRTLDPDRQRFIQSSNKKAITAVEFSPDGKFIATGESGHHPMVRLWNVADGSQLAEFAGHHFRVIAVRFSPSARYLVSLGSQDDNTLYVWDRTCGQRVASAKVTNKITGLAFSPNGQFFVTVGVRHVRFWYLETKRARNKETIPLNGRNAILGDLLHNAFMDVCCVMRSACVQRNETGSPDGGETLTLVVSKAGHLMQFSDQRYLDKWVELRTSRASCLSVHGSWVIVGCASGTCLLFDTDSLQFLAQLPLPHQLGSEAHLSNSPVQPAATNSEQLDTPMFPDLLAIKLDFTQSRAVCFYADHSVYVWDITDLSDMRRTTAYFYHSRGVWSVDCLAEPCKPKERNNKLVSLPSSWSDSTFVTCADDGTIRFWNISDELELNGTDMTTSLIGEGDLIKSSVPRTKEHLMRIIFTDPTYKLLCVSDRPTAELTYSKFEAGVGPVGGPSPSSSASGQVDSAAPSPSSPTAPSLSEAVAFSRPSSSLTPNGCCVRAVCISPDCRHLAAGDRDGILRVYSLATLEQVCQITAHDSEILSLNFFRSDSVPELALLCSASRDRLIHIFDPNQDYSLVQTVADHSAAIFAARIIETEDDGEIRLVSCGMDKSLLIRVLEPDDAGLTAHFALEHHLVGRCSQLDAAFTPTVSTYNSDNKPGKRKRYLAVACQDRRLRIYNIATGRQVRCYRGSFNEDGCLVRCAIDPTGSVVGTSGSDKQLNLFYLLSGESIAPLFGHSELALGLRFLPDLRHLVTVSADSCIFIWRLASDLTQHLSDRSTVTRRTSSCSGLSTTSSIPTGLRSTTSFRLPRSRLTKDEQSGEDESMSLSLTPNWGDSPTEYDQTDELDEDSEIDLLKLDTDELLPRDSCLLARIGRPTEVPDSSDYDDRISSVSYDSCKTAKSTISDQKDTVPNNPAFYFSVSALPAWARRKLSRRSSVALVPPSIEQVSLTAHPERLVSDASTLGGSMSGSRVATPIHSTKPDEQPKVTSDVVPGVFSKRVESEANCPPQSKHPVGAILSADSNSGSEYRVTRSSVHTRVVDSRCSRSNTSRDVSPKSNTISAPTTPFRRDRFSNENPARRSSHVLRNHVPSESTSTIRSVAMRSHSTRALRDVTPPSNTSNAAVEEGDESPLFGGSSRRVRATPGYLERAHTTSNLRRPSNIRSTPHSKSTLELRSNSGSIRDSSLNLGMKSSTRSSESCIALPTTESDQRLICSQPVPMPISESSSQVHFGTSTLEGIAERPSPNHTNNGSQFGDSRCETPLPHPQTKIHETTSVPGSKSSPVKSPVDSLNEAETGYRRPTYTAPTIASRRKVFPQDPPTTGSNRLRNSVSSIGSIKKAASALSVEVNSHSNQVNERQSSARQHPRQNSPFPHSSDVVSTCSVTHLYTSQSETPSPHSPQLSRARWAPASSSPKNQKQQLAQRMDSKPVEQNTGQSTNVSRPHRPEDLHLSSSTGRVGAKRTITNTAASSTISCTSGAQTPNAEKSFDRRRIHTLPSTHRNRPKPEQFTSARDAFHRVQEALDAALKHCAEFRRIHSDRIEELQLLRSLITEELEWRFTQLRAMLGLEPICVEPPVARALLADLVERLIPELRTSVQSDTVDAIEEPLDCKDGKAQPESSYEWVVDSTTEASPLHSKLTVEPRHTYSDHANFQLGVEGEEDQS